MTTIFHITPESQWHDAARNGRYEAPSLATQGFIHCSGAHQVIRVANAMFRNVCGLVLLRIDPEKLRSRLVYENLEGGAEKFPHVYGPIDLDSVVRVTPFAPAQDGKFDHHTQELEAGGMPA